MTTQNDELLKVVRKQQAQIDKQKTYIDELLKQNGQLINKIGNNTNTGGEQVQEREIPTGVGIVETEITPVTTTPIATKQDRTLQLPPAPEKKSPQVRRLSPLFTRNG